jgi:hypothetical protein
MRGLDSKISNRWTASDFTWTLVSRPCFTAAGNARRFGIPHSHPALGDGLDPS